MFFLTISTEEADKINIMFRKYGDQLNYFLLQYLKDDRLSEDALQETFCQIIKYIDRIGDPESAAARNYAYKIAETTAKKFYNKKKLEEDVTKPYDESLIIMRDILEANEVLASAVIGDQLDECIEQLSEADQDLLDLKYAQEWDDMQIAESLDITYEAVRQRLTRARRRLAQIIIKKREEDSRNGSEG